MMRALILVLALWVPVHATRPKDIMACNVSLDFAEKVELTSAIKNSPLACVIFKPSRQSTCIAEAIDSYRVSQGSLPLAKCLILNSEAPHGIGGRFSIEDQFVLIQGAR